MAAWAGSVADYQDHSLAGQRQDVFVVSIANSQTLHKRVDRCRLVCPPALTLFDWWCFVQKAFKHELDDG
jgi:hypothetical protein